MPIRLPDLDDRRFSDLVEEMRALIPRYAADTWTDHNVSDPGITLVELFAWLTEALIYRSNRIPEASRVRFLQLLGVDFAAARPSVIQLSISAVGLPSELVLPSGTPVVAYVNNGSETVPFETLTPARISPSVPIATVQARQTTKVAEELLGRGSGQAHQVLHLAKAHVVIDPATESPTIPIVTVDGRSWSYVPTLLDSKPDDEVFTAIPHLNAIHFGDGQPTGKHDRLGQAGRIPPKGAEIFVSYHQTLGARGVLPYDAKYEIDLYSRHLDTAIVQMASAGATFRVQCDALIAVGRNPTSVEEAREEVITSLNRRWRAITPADFEHLVLDERAFNLARAKCVPEIDLSAPHVDRMTQAGDVSLIIVPKPELLPSHSLVHGHPVEQASFSPDSNRVATVDTYGATALWDAGSGSRLAVRSRPGAIQAARFSPDGSKLATHSADDFAARIWKVQNGKQIAILHEDAIVNAIAFHPNSTTAATAADDGSVKLWNASTGHLLTVLGEHTSPVRALAFNGSGSEIAGADDDGRVLVWSLDSNQQAPRQYRHAAAVNGLVFSPDGTKLATASNDTTARLWDMTGAASPMTVKHSGSVNAVAFSRDGYVWAGGSDDGSAYIWHVETGAPVSGPLNHGGHIYDLSFSTDGRFLATASEDNTVRVWEVSSGHCHATFKHFAPVNAVAFCPAFLFDLGRSYAGDLDRSIVSDRLVNAFAEQGIRFAPNALLELVVESAGAQWRLDLDGKPAYEILDHDGMQTVYAMGRNRLASAGDDGATEIWNTDTKRKIATLRHEGAVNSVCFSLDGNKLATAGDDHSARIWDSWSGQELINVYRNDAITKIRFSPDGRYAAGAESNATVRIWGMEDGQFGSQQRTLRGSGGQIRGLDISPDNAGQWLATGSDDHTVRIFETATGNELAMALHDGAVNSVSFSPDGMRLATASSDRTVRIWPVPTLSDPVVIEAHAKSVNMVMFSPAGELLLTSGDDNTIRIFDAATGEEKAVRSEMGTVNSIAFSPTGDRVATGTQDGTVLILDPTLAMGISPILHREGAVNTVVFSPDGTMLATGSDDCFARVWDATTGLMKLCGKAEQKVVIPHGDVVRNVMFSPDGRWLASASDDGSVQIWDMWACETAATLHDHRRAVNDVRFAPNSRQMVTVGDDNVGWLYRLENDKWQQDALLRGEVHHHAVSFSADGKKLAGLRHDGCAHVWKMDSAGFTAVHQNQKRINAVAFHPMAEQIATAGDDNTVCLWDVADRNRIAVPHRENPVEVLAYSPDGQMLAAVGSEGRVWIWNLRNGQRIAILPHDDVVNAVAFDSAGEWLATASADGIARLWRVTDIARGNIRDLFILHHDGPVNSLAFQPGKDSCYLATASGDAFARLWNLDSIRIGESPEMRKLAHSTAVTSVAFNDDGTLLCAISNDNKICIWSVADAEMQGLPLEGHGGLISTIAFCPHNDVQRLATGSHDHTVRVWERQEETWVLRAILQREGPVNCVAYSPDGQLLAVASDDNAARIWDVESQTRLDALRHDGPVTLVAFSSDGSRLLTASRDSTARIWAVSDSRELLVLRHNSPVTAALYRSSGSGKEVITACEDRLVRLWNGYDGEEIMALKRDGVVNAIAFRQDGRLMATAGDDQAVRVWDAGTGRRLSIMRHADVVNAVAFSPDHEWLATASNDGSAGLWHVETGRRVHWLAHEAAITTLAFDATGGRLATADANGVARVWDSRSGNMIREFSGKTGIGGEIEFDPYGCTITHSDVGHTGSINDVKFSPKGNKLATAGEDGFAIIWSLDETKSGRLLLKHYAAVNAIVFGPCKGAPLVTASEDHAIRIWPREVWEEEHCPSAAAKITLYHDGPVRRLDFSNDGSFLASASADKTSVLWSRVDTQWCKAFTLRHTAAVTDVSFGMFEGEPWLATASADRSVQVWDVKSGCSLALLSHQAGVSTVAVKPCTRAPWLATADLAGEAWLWEVNLSKPVAVLMGHSAAVHTLAFSPDGRWLATASADRTARLWDAELGAMQAVLDSHSGAISGLLFSPRSDQLVTFGTDGLAIVWTQEGTGWEERARLFHRGSVYAAAYGQKGNWLATASADGNARIWTDLRQPTAAICFPHDAAVREVAFGPNGRQLATACDDGAASLWDIAHERKLAALRCNGILNSIAYSPNGRLLLLACADGTASLTTDFFNNVWSYLDERRLITSRHHVVGPDYTDIRIQTKVKCIPDVAIDLVRVQIRRELQRFFDPVTGGPAETGWPFGRDVHASEINQIIERLNGIDHVEMLSLFARRQDGLWQKVGSRLNIDPYSLVHLAETEIEILRRQ